MLGAFLLVHLLPVRVTLTRWEALMAGGSQPCKSAPQKGLCVVMAPPRWDTYYPATIRHHSLSQLNVTVNQ